MKTKVTDRIDERDRRARPETCLAWRARQDRPERPARPDRTPLERPDRTPLERPGRPEPNAGLRG
ncbi:dihydrolipoamide acetyltransferase component of pyruvate dehydrogenase complex [Streptomyces laurentii]|uniref:Dihydrolipoamide acetyltransferase component of pyruvate dehydrogenase complex n=1 Tax=Streptomyces laurentii TaxID=39478 RepID=A0A160P362_STRLU|nr:dihydrolipoamide acetyltransferase component of pyruvate dehydrogenase complex [Streptomyces laurentii]